MFFDKYFFQKNLYLKMEPKTNIYRLNQKDKQYITTISLQGNSIKISCKNELEPTNQFSREFTLENLKKLDDIFKIIKTPIEAIEWIDNAMKIHKVRIEDENSSFKIIFYITTNGVSHQFEIPMAKDENIYTNINTEVITGNNFNQEEKTSTKTITNIDFIREIGLEPSQIVKQSLNEDTDEIIKSIKDEQRKSLLNIKYELNDIDIKNFPLTEENRDINIAASIENNTLQEQNYQILEETKDININPETTIESLPKYEESNIDFNQFTNIKENESSALFTETQPELNSHFKMEENTFNTQDNQPQFNYEEFQTSSAQEMTSQNIETNKIENNFESKQITLEDNQATFMQKPYISPADDENIRQMGLFTTNEITNKTSSLNNNIENLVQENAQINYEDYQTKNIGSQIDTQNFINTEFNSSQIENIQSYEIGPNVEKVKFTTELDTDKNQINELHNLNSKADELIGLKSQFEEINNLKEDISQMNSHIPSNQHLANLSGKIEGNQNNENEILKGKIQELEKLISQYQQEIRNLKGNTGVKQESSEQEKEQQSIGEKIHQITVKGEIIHNSEELELIVKKISKINKKITLNLLYKATADSDKASAFHEKCDEAQCSLVLIETDKGKRFGGFTTSSWSGECIEKRDEDSFIFSLNKMKIYENIPGELAIGCYPNYGPIFLGCQIRIYDNAFSKGGTTFEKGLNFNTQEDYELTDGERTFNVKEIEVYEVIIQ